MWKPVENQSSPQESREKRCNQWKIGGGGGGGGGGGEGGGWGGGGGGGGGNSPVSAKTNFPFKIRINIRNFMLDSAT